MRTRIRLLTATALCSVSLLLGGCGDEPTDTEAATGQSEPSTSSSSRPSAKSSPTRDLAEYVDQVERVSKSMFGGSMKKIYSSFRVEPDPPAGLEYIYVFKRPVDIPRARQALASQLPVLRASFRTQVAPEMTKQGFEDPTATWTYLNPDGSEVYSHTVS